MDVTVWEPQVEMWAEASVWVPLCCVVTVLGPQAYVKEERPSELEGPQRPLVQQAGSHSTLSSRV